MFKQFLCAHGHQWQVTLLGPAPAVLAGVACPVCGAAAATADSRGAAAADALTLAGTPGSPPADALHAWAALVGYELLGELGRGGMGIVFKARQVALQRTVALKLILGATDPERRARFRAEAQAVARLQHPNVVQIYEIGDLEGRSYLALEFVAGGSLAQQLAGEPQPVRAAAGTVQTLARAVHYAHRQGVVHRDLKPANVLLTADGAPKVTDFGLAKLLEAEAGPDAPPPPGRTHSGAVLGTPSYMAPEQAAGHPPAVGPAADVYALGALLYEMLTGRPPFLAATPLETLDQVRSQEPVPPRQLRANIPRDLETICLKCLRKEPARRYATADDLADDLGRFLAGSPIRARPVGMTERLWRWGRRNPVVAGLTAAVSLTLVLCTAVAWVLAVEARAARERAEASLHLARQAGHQHFVRLSEIELGKEPGLQNVRKQLLGDALAYFQGLLEQDGADPKLRADVADAHFRAGLITRQIGSAEQALALYQRAADAYEQLVREDPSRREYRERLAVCDDGLALLHRAAGRLGEAARLHARAVELLEKLAREHPADVALQQRLARFLVNRSILLARQRQAAKALEGYEAARSVLEQLVRDHPGRTDFARDLGTVHNNAGVLHKDQPGGQDEARRCYVRALELRDRLARENPAEFEYRSDLGDTRNNLGVLYLDWPGRLGEAGPALRKALALRDRLARDNPAVTRYQVNLADTHNNLGILEDLGGRPDEALTSFRQALAVRAKLAQTHLGVVAYQRAWAASHYNVGHFLAKQGRKAEALEEHRRALALRQKLADAHPGDAALRQDVAASRRQVDWLTPPP